MLYIGLRVTTKKHLKKIHKKEKEVKSYKYKELSNHKEDFPGGSDGKASVYNA